MGKTTFTGPVAGSYLSLSYTQGLGAHTRPQDDVIPTGMIFRLYAVSAFQRTGGSTTITVGTTADPDGYVIIKSLTADVARYMPLDGALLTPVGWTVLGVPNAWAGTVDLIGGDTDDLDIVTGGTHGDPVQIVLHGYVVGHADALNVEGV